MLRTYFQETFYDMEVSVAQKYAEGIRLAIMTGKDFDGEKKEGYFISKKRGFEDKLYIGDIHRIENHLSWNDEELADDDQIINVVMLDGPVTRDGDGCSYGSKDHRDQIMYANTIPQVIGHLFIINTPGGAASARIDYEQAISDCRAKGKPTVAWVDGMCCSAGQWVAALCDRTVVMNGRDTMGCIGTMCAFWGVANTTVSQDGYRYIELVSVTSPDKNVEYREATEGKTEKLQAELDKLGEEFRETVRQNRPLVKEEHLTGKTFDADEVMGELVDEVGDYERAIECVFELAGETLTPARLMTAVQEEPEDEHDDEHDDEPEDKALEAPATDESKADEGETGGSETGESETAPTNNNNDMTKEEKKDAEVLEAQSAVNQDAKVQDEPATEAQAPAAEEAPLQEEQEAQGGAPAGEAPAAEDAATHGGEAPCAAAAEQPSVQTVEDATAEIGRITETLHNAEQMVAEKDKTIADMQETLDATAADLATANDALAERDKSIEALNGDAEVLRSDIAAKDAAIAERDKAIAEHVAAIEALKKQVADLKTEVKELSGKPTPMVDGNAPQGNGIGEAPKTKKRITSDMSYEEIRALKEKEREADKK